MRAIIRGVLLASLALSGCASTGTTTPQSTAQQIQSHWPLIVSVTNLAIIADGSNPTALALATKTEGELGPQIAACAAGTDPTCAAQIQGGIAGLLGGLKLGPKGMAELALLQAILPLVAPGFTLPVAMNAPGFTYASSGNRVLMGRSP
jgi:outer membrane lipoprotein SlyB